MNKRIVALSIWMVIPLLLCAMCPAQSGDGFDPVSTNVPDAKYPRINANSQIEFRLKAPDARTVEVQVGTYPKVPMVKG